MAKTNGKGSTAKLPKAPTGIQGLDEITGGGFPRGRPTLVCGAAGCGKTLLAMEFLVRGAIEQGEPGVFIAFEETAEELAANVRSLGFDLDKLTDQKKLLVDHIVLDRSEIEENGEYDLDGLFIRLGYAIDAIGAKRVVLDTIETLFGGFSNQAILRAELRRLFRWLKDKGVTAVITGGARRRDAHPPGPRGVRLGLRDPARSPGQRAGLDPAAADRQVPRHRARHQRVSVPDRRGRLLGPADHLAGPRPRRLRRADLDRDRRAWTRCSAARASTGAAASSSAARRAPARPASRRTSPASRCARGERCLYFAFEESESQIVRNMRSIGIDLRPWIKKGLLKFIAARPTANGLEMHLALMHRAIRAVPAAHGRRRSDQQPRRRGDAAATRRRCSPA